MADVAVCDLQIFRPQPNTSQSCRHRRPVHA